MSNVSNVTLHPKGKLVRLRFFSFVRALWRSEVVAWPPERWGVELRKAGYTNEAD